MRTPEVTYTWREEAQGSKQNSEALFKGISRTVFNIIRFLCKSSLSKSNYMKLQSTMWVSCAPPIARVQQRLVVILIDVAYTLTNKHPRISPSGVIFRKHHLWCNVDWNIIQTDNIQKLIYSYQFYVTGSPSYRNTGTTKHHRV